MRTLLIATTLVFAASTTAFADSASDAMQTCNAFENYSDKAACKENYFLSRDKAYGQPSAELQAKYGERAATSPIQFGNKS